MPDACLICTNASWTHFLSAGQVSVRPSSVMKSIPFPKFFLPTPSWYSKKWFSEHCYSQIPSYPAKRPAVRISTVSWHQPGRAAYPGLSYPGPLSRFHAHIFRISCSDKPPFTKPCLFYHINKTVSTNGSKISTRCFIWVVFSVVESGLWGFHFFLP